MRSENLQKLLQVLTELKDVSVLSETNKFLLSKYGIQFNDAENTMIDTISLLSCCHSYFSFDIAEDELRKLIPTACKLLNMKCVPFMTGSDPMRPEQVEYDVYLR